MANQVLKVWSSLPVADPIKGNTQLADITEEEWIQGVGYLQGWSTQMLNQLFMLLSSHSAPNDICAHLHPTNLPLNEVTLPLDGRALSQSTSPRLFEVYGANLPNLNNDNPITGFTWVVRNQ